MDLYIPALMLLSGGAFIHSRSNVPELRPAAEGADLAWKLLSRLAFFLWLGLLIWGFYRRDWLTVAAGFGVSLAFNVALALPGPKSVWPGLSMLFSVAGLAAGIYTVLG